MWPHSEATLLQKWPQSEAASTNVHLMLNSFTPFHFSAYSKDWPWGRCRRYRVSTASFRPRWAAPRAIIPRRSSTRADSVTDSRRLPGCHQSARLFRASLPSHLGHGLGFQSQNGLEFMGRHQPVSVFRVREAEGFEACRVS